MAEPSLQIDRRCDHIETAITTIVDRLVHADVGFSTEEAQAIKRILKGDYTITSPDQPEEQTEEFELPGETERAHVIARKFHETYERLAPSFGYETRKESAVPWEDLPNQNKALMIAVVADLLWNNIIEAKTS